MQLFILIISLFYQEVTFNEKNNYLVVNDSLFGLTVGDDKFKHSKINKDEIFDLTKFSFFLFNEKSYLLNQRSGLVYLIDQDTIKRIDKSYDDRIHSKSVDFIFNDTLYRFGGYGYYNAHKILTFFDKSSNEWDFVKYEGHNKINGFSYYGFYYLDESKIVVISYSTHENKYQNEDEIKHEGISLDLEKKVLVEKFDLNPNFNLPENFIQINNKYLFLFYRKERKILIYDIPNEIMFEYKLNQNQSQIVSNRPMSITSTTNKIYYVSKNQDLEEYINLIDIQNVLDNMVELDMNFRKDRKNQNIYLSFFFLSIIIILTYYRERKNSEYILRDNKLFFENRFIELDSEMIEIMKLILEDKEVENSVLNKVFEIEGHNIDHINRRKNKKIEELNISWKSVFGQKLIQKIKSKKDKRMIVYKLNRK